MGDENLTGLQMPENVGLQIERLTGQALGKTVEIGGREYTTVPVYDPRRPEPEPLVLKVATLQGFADIVKDEPETDVEYVERHAVFVHVASPTEVRLLTGIFGEFHQRVEVARAEAIVPGFEYGAFLDQESFTIRLLCRFAPDDGREAVLKLVGNLQDEQVQTLADDGVTQRASARAGIVKRADVEVPNPVELTPYSSFAEVEQVRRPFVLRLRGGGDGKPPTCALFECDGGRWRLEAIKRVKDWLAGELPGVAIYG